MYQSVQLPSGKWGKKTGKSIGTIIADKGFIPNRNYHLYEGTQSQDEITVLEYGQYALIGEIAHDVLTSLERHFPADRACQILLMPVSSTPMGLSIKIRFIVTTSRAGFRRNTKPFPSKWEKLLLVLFWITLEEEPQG